MEYPLLTLFLPQREGGEGGTQEILYREALPQGPDPYRFFFFFFFFLTIILPVLVCAEKEHFDWLPEHVLN